MSVLRENLKLKRSSCLNMLWVACVFLVVPYYTMYIQDAELPEGLQDLVFVRSMNCGEPIQAFLSLMTAVRSQRFPAEVLRRSDS